MKSLPESLGNPVGFAELFVNSTPLETQPDSVCLLRSLIWLHLEDTRIRILPDAFGELEKLRHVSLQGSRVRLLPESFKKLNELHRFLLTISSSLNDGKQLDSGQHSTMSSSHQDLGCLASLEFEFDVGPLESGGEKPGVEEEGETFERIPGFLSLSIPFHRIISLRIFGEHTRQSLLRALFFSLNKLTSPLPLHLGFFNEVEALASELGTLTHVEAVTISSCEKLRDLPESLGLLRHLNLRDLPRLRRLPECLGVAKRLRKLSVINCGSLQSMPTSFGHRFPLDRDSSTACGDECANSTDSSPSLDHELPHILIYANSWRLLRCFLESGSSRSCTIQFTANCEDMKRLRKMAVEWQGGDNIVKFKVTTMILRKLCLQWQAGDTIHLHGLLGPSTVWLPLNDVTRTRILLQCETFLDFSCEIRGHGKVRVLDIEEEDAIDTEEDSDRNQVQDSHNSYEESENIDESADEEDQDSQPSENENKAKRRKLIDSRQRGED